GNRFAFSEIVRRHQKGMLRLCIRFVKDVNLAEDVVQDAFIKAYEKLGSFEGRSSFKSWLFQIAVNTAKNKLREFKSDMTDIDNVHLGVGPVAEQNLLDSSLAELIQVEVERLPDRQKTALILRVYEDMSFKEIAQIMDCPYDTAKANYRHALMKLRHAFEENQELKSWNEQTQNNLFTEFNRYAMEAES
ncbi:MAG: RNA polymerase sigma factor, partial [Pseudobdellovibrionaceae bacterium]